MTERKKEAMKKYQQRYWDLYLDYLKSSSSKKEAWIKTEENHKLVHHYRRFTSYESFRTNKYRYLKSLKGELVCNEFRERDQPFIRSQ